MTVFFDASVIIAAMISPMGGSSLLLEYIKAGKIVGITSLTVIDEILEEDKSRKLNRSKKEMEQFIAASGLLVRESITAADIVPYQGSIDAEDAHLIAGANLTRCEYLVTLDKKHLLGKDIRQHFLPLKIVSPKELLAEIVKDNNNLERNLE